MTNLGVEQALRGRGIDVVRAAVGDRYVLEELLRARLAARRRGLGPPARARQAHHRRRHRQRACMVLQAVVRAGRPLADLLRASTLFPQTLINVRVTAGPGLDGERARSPTARAEVDRRARRRRPGADPAVGHRAGGARDGRGARRGAGAALRRAARGDARLESRGRRRASRARSSRVDGATHGRMTAPRPSPECTVVVRDAPSLSRRRHARVLESRTIELHRLVQTKALAMTRFAFAARSRAAVLDCSPLAAWRRT